MEFISDFIKLLSLYMYTLVLVVTYIDRMFLYVQNASEKATTADKLLMELCQSVCASCESQSVNLNLYKESYKNLLAFLN